MSDSTPSPREPFAEEVARERQRSEAALGKGARRGQPERVVQDAVGLGVVGGVAGLTGALLVLEAEEGERAGVVGLGAEPGLKLADRGRRVTGGRERGDDPESGAAAASAGCDGAAGDSERIPPNRAEPAATQITTSARRSLRGRRLLPIVLVLRFIPAVG